MGIIHLNQSSLRFSVSFSCKGSRNKHIWEPLLCAKPRFCHFTGNISFTPHYEVTAILSHCPDEETEATEVKSLAQGHRAGKLGFKSSESECGGSRVQGLTTQLYHHLLIKDQEAALWGHDEQGQRQPLWRGLTIGWAPESFPSQTHH